MPQINVFWKTLLTGFLGIALIFGARYGRAWMNGPGTFYNNAQLERTLREREAAMVRSNFNTVRPAPPSSYRAPVKPPPFYKPPIKPPSYTYNSRR